MEFSFHIVTYGWTYHDRYAANGRGSFNMAMDALAKSHLSGRSEEARKRIKETGRYETTAEARGGTCHASILPLCKN